MLDVDLPLPLPHGGRIQKQAKIALEVLERLKI
jgi:hypothetical protein